MTGHELLNIPEKIYIVGDISTRRIRIDNELLTPAHSRRIYNHSPDGFNWGHSGSGPAQLALALLLKYLPIDDAVQYYQAFKQTTVAWWPQSDFAIHINLRAVIISLLK